MYRSPRGLRIDFFCRFSSQQSFTGQVPPVDHLSEAFPQGPGSIGELHTKKEIHYKSISGFCCCKHPYLTQKRLATFAKSCLVGEPWHDDHRHSVVDRLVGAHQAAVGYEKAAVGVACIGKIMSKIPS